MSPGRPANRPRGNYKASSTSYLAARKGHLRVNILIRDTTPDDLPEIFRIQTDPVVRVHQYRFGPNDSLERWTRLLAGHDCAEASRFRCSTIRLGSAIIGHVTHWHWCIDGLRACQCGWNLDPEYWGQGVMCAALSELFDTLFGVEGVQYVFADCFRNNRRCLRVMEKLGFVPNGIPPYQRLLLAWQMRCLRWILRFRLDAEAWRSRTAGDRASNH